MDFGSVVPVFKASVMTSQSETHLNGVMIGVPKF